KQHTASGNCAVARKIENKKNEESRVLSRGLAPRVKHSTIRVRGKAAGEAYRQARPSPAGTSTGCLVCAPGTMAFSLYRKPLITRKEVPHGTAKRSVGKDPGSREARAQATLPDREAGGADCPMQYQRTRLPTWLSGWPVSARDHAGCRVAA